MIHAAHVVVYFLINSDIGQKQWKWYLDDHSGPPDFQIDLALSVMVINYRISLQWDGELVERPNFMQQVFFCEWNHQRHCTSTKEESKRNYGIQMWGMCSDE